MEKKAKSFLSEFLRDQFSDIFSHFITIPILSLILGACGAIWAKRTEILVWFYSGIRQMNLPEIAKAVIGFVVPMLGFGVIAFFAISTPFWISNSLKNKKKSKSAPGDNNEIVEPRSVFKTFSSYLDEMIESKKKEISGRGIVFLNKIKAAPPFLGIEHSKHVLSPEIERKFTEYFVARDFKEANKENIRGGTYRAVYGDNPKKVARKVYGKTKFASKIPYHTFANGSHYTLPFIDISESLELSSEEIANRFSKAEVSYIEPTYKELTNQQSLPEDEALWLVEMIYEAAKKVRKNSAV